MTPAQVLILMGSESDRAVFEAALPYYRHFGIQAEMKVSSAHRNPEQTARLAREARRAGVAVIVCGAGMAAHLAGVVAAHSSLPVIGVPLDASPLGGLDALLATVQMPAGIPVATVAIGKAGAINAAVLAARILSLGDPELAARLDAFMAAGARLS
ncbi:MAG: 5-(carboxyamino)imidazole ribonucleotide mutase [bacterium]|jgi:phosphoribosylaminoimidazole carboxylase PurE protein|nr:5-(carboxyamino)imidazole ribonucleotide mutase [bacterium]